MSDPTVDTPTHEMTAGEPNAETLAPEAASDAAPVDAGGSEPLAEATANDSGDAAAETQDAAPEAAEEAASQADPVAVEAAAEAAAQSTVELTGDRASDPVAAEAAEEAAAGEGTDEVADQGSAAAVETAAVETDAADTDVGDASETEGETSEASDETEGETEASDDDSATGGEGSETGGEAAETGGEAAAAGEKPAGGEGRQKGKGQGQGQGGGAERHQIKERAEDSGGVSEVPPVDISQLPEEMVALAAAMEGKNPVEGKVIGWNKGGYHVAVGKIAAFCPVSQMEIGNPRSPKKYLDKAFMFHVMEIQQNGRRVVVSRQGVIRKEREAAAAKVRENVKVGAELQGRVSSITDFGAFVDLGGGVEGLVHVSELSRRRVEHAKELVQVGQTVKVAVLKVEKNGKRISLSMKKLEADPWDILPETLQPGSEFEGKVMRKSEFGLFVEVLPGVEGLVHTSRLQLGTNLESPVYEPGSMVKGWVQEVDKKRRRLSLSLRELGSANPWKGIGDRFPEGQMVTGKVEKLTNFGVFIELEPGLTGLLAFAQLTGAGNPKRQFQVGREVNVRILSVDRDKKRISLGTEASKAEGGQSDFRDYVRQQRESSGMGALAAALAKARSGNG